MRPVGDYILVSDLCEQSRGIVRGTVKDVPVKFKGEVSRGDIICFRNRNRREVRGHQFVNADSILVIRKERPVAV